MDVVEKRKRLRKDCIEKSIRWVSTLPFKVTAVLVGSYARGDFNLWSDVDLLLISDEFRGSPIERLRRLNPPAGFQVIPITRKEFKTLVEKGEPLAVEAMKIGVVLADELKLFGKRAKTRRTQTGLHPLSRES